MCETVGCFTTSQMLDLIGYSQHVCSTLIFFIFHLHAISETTHIQHGKEMRLLKGMMPGLALKQ